MLKQNIAKLLESEMDRKDFLKTLGITIVAFTGATAALKTITNHTSMLSSGQATQQPRGGYGTFAYGGAKEVQRSASADSYSS